MDAFKPILAKVATGQPLSRFRGARPPSTSMLSGEVTPAQIGAFLMALQGARRDRRGDHRRGRRPCGRKMLRVDAPAGAIDIVGTGGDSSAPSTSRRSPR